MKPALLINDMQKDVMKKLVTAGTGIIPNIRKTLDAFREKNLPVVHMNRIHRPDGVDVELFRQKLFKEKPFLVRGTEGAEIVDELRPVEGEYVVERQRFSAFFQTELQLILKRLGVDTLVIAGVQTPNCVRATVVNAIGYDYNVVVLNDATAAATPEVHKANLFDMKNMGVEILGVDEFLSFDGLYTVTS